MAPEINQVGFFLLLFEPVSALGVCVEYEAYFGDRKHFSGLFWKNGCLKMPGFNKDEEKDVGPSVYMLFVLFCTCKRDSVPTLAQKRTSP